jgi:hypothetical protein
VNGRYLDNSLNQLLALAARRAVQLVAGAALRACTAIAFPFTCARAPPKPKQAQGTAARRAPPQSREREQPKQRSKQQAAGRLLAQPLGQHLDLPDCANTQPV